ncbi:EsaB/YukD family protein [Bifidobacterium cuniculi]|uniref:EsaB/YukD family protein n=1 Tax=Bifidobacterium cuniculi TaxID=1688 RepID=UPI000AC80DFB|nr:EsaB/YukD family protein [Bifidobacterium cuniculi]
MRIGTTTPPAPAPAAPPPATPPPTYFDPGAHLHDDELRARRLHLTIAYGSRSIDLDVGPGPIIAELLPDIARRLGALDPTIAHGGYHLVTEEGVDLDPAATFAEQAVANNSVLTLHPGVLDDDEVVYDDIVEAVGDSVARVYRPWTREQTMVTSLIVSVGMLLMGAALLAVQPAGVVNASLALGFAVVLVTLSAVLNAKELPAQATAIGLSAAVFGAIGGYQMTASFVPQPSFYGTALLGGCGALAVFGAAVALLCPATRPYSLLPVAIGAVTAVPAALGVLFPTAATAIWIAATAVVAVVGNFLPWATLSLARLSVDSPQSEAEIFELPDDIDVKDVRQRYAAGSTMLFIAHIASAALLLLSVPLLAAQPAPYAGVMAVAAFLAMLIGSRQIHAMREVAVTVGATAVGLAATCALFARSHPEQAPALTVALVVAALVTVVVTYVTRRQSLFATRVADAAETVCLVAILPLAYLAIAV